MSLETPTSSTRLRESTSSGCFPAAASADAGHQPKCEREFFRTWRLERDLACVGVVTKPYGGQADSYRLTPREASGNRARSRTSRLAARTGHRSAVRPPESGFGATPT